MAEPDLSAAADIDAPPHVLYAILADYNEHHPRILPRPPFESLTVEQGGTGAGTVIRVGIRLLGRLQSYRATVTEPEPGRVLVETNENGYATSFTVDPRADGASATVTIATKLSGRGGISGAIERRFVTWLLRPVYTRELENLAAVARDL
ncbi:MAG TPA: SRPBCC family protein [Longimicrobiales bacterium]|nr:SRPBCC family protein [Longimicrobiales bacterium]